ncbi:MAG TPA: glycosyltransferase family 39 protein [Longimicrobiales bacterium]|nr:glycosyltransferase family 39 protein [Longimicrobiales bacterium]
MSAAEDRRARAWLLAIVGVAIATRIYHLGTWDLWTDEVQTLLTSASLDFKEGPMYRTAPVNFVLTGFALRVFGDGILTARALSFVAGVLTVPLTYVFAVRRFGRRAALVAAAIVTTSMWHVFWSQTARHFALLTLLLLAATHLLLRVLEEEGGVPRAVVAGILMVAALFTHSSAGFFIGTLFLYAVWCWVEARRARRPARAMSAGMVASAVPLLVYVPVYASLGSYLLENKAPWNPWWNIVGSLSFYVVPAVALTAIGGAVALAREGDRRGVLLASLFLVPAVLVTAAATQTIASAAYVLPALPSLAVLVGVASDRVLRAAESRPARAAALAMVLVVVASQAYQLAHYYVFYNGLKPRWREVTAFVAEHRAPGERLFASEGDVAAAYLDADAADWISAAPDVEPTGRWFAVYLEERLTGNPDERIRRLESARLMATFPLHYGPKDRTIGVFYEPAAEPSAGAGPANAP